MAFPKYSVVSLKLAMRQHVGAGESSSDML